MFAVEQCFSEGAVSIRASGSSTTSSTAGRVQYCLRPSSGNGSLFWALVCNSTFHLNEAHVACRSSNPDYAAYNTLPGAMWASSLVLRYIICTYVCTYFHVWIGHVLLSHSFPSPLLSFLFILVYHIPDSPRLTLLTRLRCSVVGLRAQWQTATWQRCHPRGAVFSWQQVLHAIPVSTYVCLSGGTYMGMKETWQLLEIIHFHVAFQLVCGSPTYYILYIRMLTRPHTDVAFCVKWTEKARRLYCARTLCNICVYYDSTAERNIARDTRATKSKCACTV